MSLRFASLAFLLSVPLLSPLAVAQVDADATLAVALDPAVATNQTLAAIPVTVDFSITQFPCVGQAAQFTIALTAEGESEPTMVNGTPDANVSASAAPYVEVVPATLTVTVPASSAVATTYSTSETALLTVAPGNPGSAQNVTATVTATVTGVSGCATASAEGPEATASTQVEFLAPTFAARPTGDGGQAMPGLGLWALAAVLALTALARRQR
jgi:hypothetical protein